jgi:hypothetical protein
LSIFLVLRVFGEWRDDRAGLSVSHASVASEKLRKIVADLSLDKEMLQDALRRKT